MAAVHHPKSESITLCKVDPLYRETAAALAAEQGITIGQYATQKFLEGLRTDLMNQEMSQPDPLPEIIMPELLHKPETAR